MKYSVIFLLIFLFQTSSLGAQEITVDVEPEVIEIGQTFTYTIDATIEGGETIQIRRLPNFKNFIHLGTQTAPRLININGKVTRGLSVFVKLKAKKKGTLTLQSPVLYFGRRPLKGPEAKIKVVPKGKLPKSKRPKRYPGYYIEAKRSPIGDLYVGQQVNVSYELFTAGSGNSGPQPPSEPELDEFWIEDLSQKNTGQTQLVTVKGKMLRKTTLRSYALFPLKSGPLTINAMEMELILGSMFRSKTIKIASTPIKLNVKPLPPNAPKGFYEGNVGRWKLRAFAPTRRVKTGEPFVFTISLEGEGQVGRVRLPPLIQIDGAKATKGEESAEKGTRRKGNTLVVFGKKTVEYSIIPNQIGDLEIPSLTFSYFDPKTRTYETVKSEPIQLRVSKGKNDGLHPPQKKRAEPNKRGSTDDIIIELEAKLRPFNNKLNLVSASEQPLLLFIALAAPAFLGLMWLLMGARVKKWLARSTAPNEREEVSSLANLIDGLQSIDDIRAVKRALLLALSLPPGASISRLETTLLERFDDPKTVEQILETFKREQVLKYNPDLKDTIDVQVLKKAILKIIPNLFILLSFFFVFASSPPVNATEPSKGELELLKQESGNADYPSFYFQVAGEALKNKNYGVARWALERAVFLEPSFDDASHNLGILNQIVRIRSIEASNRGLTLDGNEGIFWWRFFGNMSSIFWGSIFVLFWWGTFALFFFGSRPKSTKDSISKARRDLFLTLGIISLTIAIVLTIAVVIRWHIRRTVNPVVVIGQTLVLKEGPNAQANTIMTPRTVVPGVMLNVNKRKGKWSRIEFPDGSGAWLKGDDIWFVQEQSNLK